jgi:indole-3-glycerol phosphate synthase
VTVKPSRSCADRPDFLAEMAADAHERVAAARAREPLTRPESPGQPGRLSRALTRCGSDGRLTVIAEVKRRSPSKGAIAPALDAVGQARVYEAAGADAVSVLTQPSRFGGRLEDLRTVTAAIGLPVLRKDFIVDPYQVREAAHADAAAVLLIVAMLDDELLDELLTESTACGLDALVEVHDEVDLLRAVKAGAKLIGINNRDLRTLNVDLNVTVSLAPLSPTGSLLVSESGITSAADAKRVADAGVRAVLVGEALVRRSHGEIPDFMRTLRDPRGIEAQA